MSFTSHPLLSLAAAIGLTFASPAWADDHAEVDRLIGAGQWAEAAQKADQFIAAHPRDARMRFLKGLVLSEQNRTPESIAVFVKLTEDFPELPEPYNNLAVLYGKQGQYDQARKALESAIRTNPSYATAYENLGDVYAKLASQAYSKALQIDGNNAKVTPKLAMIRDLFAPHATAVAQASQLPKASPATASPASASAASRPSSPPPVVVAAAPKPVSPPAPPVITPTPSPALAASAPASHPAPAPAVAVPSSPSPSQARAPAPPAAAAAASASGKPASATAVASASTAASAPAPSNPPTPTAKTSDSADVEAAVNGWASAWSRKDMDAYFAAYTTEFNGGKSRKAWEEERRARIVGKRSISVSLSDFETLVKGDRATVQFRQAYAADALKVSSRKTLEMVRVDGRWRIQKESTGS